MAAKSIEKVVALPLRPTSSKTADRKWSKQVMQLGFCIIPSLLLRAQQRLGLNPTQLAVLLQLADYWWDESRKPYPSKQALSERLGLGERQIQRHIADLEAAGLVTRIQRTAENGGKLSNEYDLSGLVARLAKLAPEVAAAAEAKKKVTRKGGAGLQDLPKK